jgi:acetolactate synthase-1/2/3 large subunit
MGIAGNAFGPLGVGMGYAMAAKLAHPDKKVLLVTGDGAFGYGIAEYDTCMRYGINITAVIFNDGLWGMIKRSEQRKAPGETNFVGLDLEQNTHYEKVVEGLGGYGELVTNIDDLRPAIQRAVASGKPGCVNVMVNPAIGPKGAGC